jgi:hypothetical protein
MKVVSGAHRTPIITVLLLVNEDIDHNCITTKTKYLIAATNKKSKTCISKQLK